MFKNKDIIKRAIQEELDALAKIQGEKCKKTLIKCEAAKCQNTNLNSEVKFFKISIKDPEREKKWHANITMKDSKIKKKFLCSDHFEENAFTNTFRTHLIRGAAPTIQDPRDLGNEKPKPYPCLNGFSTLRDHNSVKENITGPPAKTLTPDGTGRVPHNKSCGDLKSTHLQYKHASSLPSVPRTPSKICNINNWGRGLNKSTMTTLYSASQISAIVKLKTELRAKMTIISNLKRKFRRIDAKKPRPAELIKYASHYLSGKTLALFASQIKKSEAAGKQKQGWRWTSEDIEIANAIHQMSRNVYTYLSSNNILNLPGKSTLRRFRNAKKKTCNPANNETEKTCSEVSTKAAIECSQKIVKTVVNRNKNFGKTAEKHNKNLAKTAVKHKQISAKTAVKHKQISAKTAVKRKQISAKTPVKHKQISAKTPVKRKQISAETAQKCQTLAQSVEDHQIAAKSSENLQILAQIAEDHQISAQITENYQILGKPAPIHNKFLAVTDGSVDEVAITVDHNYMKYYNNVISVQPYEIEGESYEVIECEELMDQPAEIVTVEADIEHLTNP